MARFIGMGIIGLGRAGLIHFKNVVGNPRVNVKYLVDDQTSIAEKLVRDYRLQGTKTLHSKDIDVLLNDSSVEACVIAAPTDHHESFTLRCLDAGKAVLCEKPLANSLDAVGKLSRRS